MTDLSLAITHFDSGTVDQLARDSRALAGITGMPLYMLSVGHESGFPDITLTCEDIRTSRDQREAAVGLSLPLNAKGVPWIERYLVKMAGPMRAPPESEQPLSEWNQTRELRLYTAGAVFGQCVAQELDLHWIEDHIDAGRPWLRSKDFTKLPGMFDPWNAVREFADLGEQASLVVQLNALRNRAPNQALMTRVIGWMRANIRRELLVQIHTEQRWHSPAGELEAVIFLNAEGCEVRRIEFQREHDHVEFKDVTLPCA